MNTALVILLLWVLPALVLAPILAWAMLKKPQGQPAAPAEQNSPSSEVAHLQQGVEAQASDDPEETRSGSQAEDTPSRELIALNIANQSHALP